MLENKSVILALTDGKAGHETQTQGLAQVLNQSNVYVVEWLDIRLPSKWHYKFLRFLIKYSRNTSWLKYFFNQQQLNQISKQSVKYIVSSGGNTLVANVLLKAYLSKQQLVQNIVASSLRGVPACFFDAVFTIHAEQKDLTHYVYYPIAPNKMTANPLTQAQAREHLGILKSDTVICILIGSDTKTVKIGSASKWGKILLTVRKQYPDARILLTTSRRTSVAFEKELKEFISQHQLFSALDKSIWISQGMCCDVRDFIKAADWALVSSDSTSMIAEVIMAEKKLLVVSAEEMLDSAVQLQLKYLQEQKQLMLCDLGQINKVSVLLQGIQVQAHSKKFHQVLNKQLAERSSNY